MVWLLHSLTLISSLYLPSLSVVGHTHGDHSHGESPFWAEGRQWNSYQEWSQSEEFKNNFPRHVCGMEDPTLEELKGGNRVTQSWLKKHTCEGPNSNARNPHCKLISRQAQPPIPVQVKWHSVGREDGSGAATLQQILDSVAQLNAAYTHPTGGFTFLFDPATDLTIDYNDRWHWSDDIDDTEFKSVLRQGDCSILNIYTTGSFGGIFGWATKAYKCEDGYECYHLCETDMIDDGVVLRYDLLRGGPVEDYSEGDVLVHEVGHWLGLYHTFQGKGCSYPGDFIEDTPAEHMPAFGCDKVRDSCQGEEDFPSGVDPIHNYMDLSNDPCMFEFTDGQFAWMYAQWDTWRAADTIPPTTIPPTTMPPTTIPPTTLPPTTTAPVPIFSVSPFAPPPDFLTLSPVAVSNPPATALPVTPSPVTSAPVSSGMDTLAPAFLPQQKTPMEAKCGTVKAQSGSSYGGAAGQAKGCGSRRIEEQQGERKRPLKGQ